MAVEAQVKLLLQGNPVVFFLSTESCAGGFQKGGQGIQTLTYLWGPPKMDCNFLESPI